MAAPKSRSGNAYITVLTVTMLMLMLVVVTLNITAVSRRLTALYSDYAGLYDLAVAGNEQALFLIRQAHNSQREDVYSRAWQRAIDENIIVFMYHKGGLALQSPDIYSRRHDPAFSNGQFRRIFSEEAVNGLMPHMRSIFPLSPDYMRRWSIDATINAGEFTITDSYSAETTATEETDRLDLVTRVHRDINGYPSIPAVVRASIIWTAASHREIILDAYTIADLILAGVEFPILPTNGESLILFLDEFVLTMVESMRLEARRRN